MTEEQIIKALECCIDNNCYSCPDAVANSVGKCECNLMRDALELITRQKSTIDEMTKAYKSLKSEKNAEIEQKDIEINLLIEKKEAAYDEISGLNAVLERLRGINEILESAFVAECDLSACPRKKEIRDEAIKEFAERLTDKADLTTVNGFDSKWVISQEIIDNLVKEMVGDE